MRIFGVIFAMVLQAGAEEVLMPMAQLGKAGFLHAGSLSEIRVLSDGERVLSTSRDGTTRLWNLESGEELQRYSKDAAYDVWGVAVLPGEKEIVAAGGGGHVVRYDLETGKELMSYKHEETAYRVDVHPNGKWMVVGDSKGLIKLWEIGTGKMLRDFEGHTKDVYTVVFDGTGDFVISGSEDGKVKRWEVATGKCVDTIKKKFGDVYTIVRSPDGKRFAVTSEDERVGVYECDSLKVVWETKLENEAQVVAWSPDGRYVAAPCADYQLYVFDGLSGEIVRKIDTEERSHTPVAFSEDGKVIISGDSKLLYLHRAETGERVVPTLGIPLHTNYVNSVAIGPGGTKVYASGSSDGWNLWNLAEGTREQVTGAATAMAVSPDGTLVAVGDERGVIQFVDGESGEKMRSVRHGERVQVLAFSPDGTNLVSGGDDDRAVRWSVADGKRQRTFTGHGEDIVDLSISADGMTLITASQDKTVAYWNMGDGQRLRNLEVGKRAPESIAVIDHGRSFLLGIGEENLMGRLLKPMAPPVPVDEARVKVLVGQLADREFAKRDEATNSLVAMGAPVLKLLGQLEVDDPEVRSRMRGVGDLISGKAEAGAIEKLAELADDTGELAADPLQRYWVAITGDEADAALVIGEVIDQKIKILQTLRTGHSPVSLAFSPDGGHFVAGNRDGTVDVFEVKRE
ncbi:MAG: WD40 repeat domain-containing protein [Verrucomicrobiaceae bacterium]